MTEAQRAKLEQVSKALHKLQHMQVCVEKLLEEHSAMADHIVKLKNPHNRMHQLTRDEIGLVLDFQSEETTFHDNVQQIMLNHLSAMVVSLKSVAQEIQPDHDIDFDSMQC